jgi:hypothetical protein
MATKTETASGRKREQRSNMNSRWIVVLPALLGFFFTGCKKGDGWDEYKYRDAGFAISSPKLPVAFPQSQDDNPNTRAYGIKYDNRSEIIITMGPLDMYENLPDKEKLQRLKDLTVRGTSSKLISEKEISLDGNPGIEIEIESSSKHLRAREYMVNGKILAIQSSAPVGQPFVADTDRIFDSLQLLR